MSVICFLEGLLEVFAFEFSVPFRLFLKFLL
jgi:hypothetical protein